jgi:hypothetical protein
MAFYLGGWMDFLSRLWVLSDCNVDCVMNRLLYKSFLLCSLTNFSLEGNGWHLLNYIRTAKFACFLETGELLSSQIIVVKLIFRVAEIIDFCLFFRQFIFNANLVIKA